MVASSTRNGEDLQIAPGLHVASLTLWITRLQITLAKIQQSLPEMKRSGKTVLSAIASEQLYDETSTPRAGTVLRQAEFIPGLLQQLQDEPKKVIEEFEVIRETCALCCIVTKLLTSKPTFLSSNKTGGNQVLGHRKHP